MLGKEKRKKIHQIVDLALEVSQGKADVFVYYYGHTNELDVDIHNQGFRENNVADTRTRLYLDGSLSAKLADYNKVIRELKRLKKEQVKCLK